MFKSKTTWLIIILIVLIIIILSLQLVLGKHNKNGPEETQLQSPKPSAQVKKSNFTLIKTNLPSASPIGITDNIELTFSQPIALEDFDFNISPDKQTEFSRDQSGRTLTLKPKGTWDFNTHYKAVIKNNIKSLSGETPDSDIIVEFNTTPYAGI